MARQKLVEQHAHAPEVRAVIDVIITLSRFGRCITCRPEQGTSLRKQGERFFQNELRNTKVEDLYRAGSLNALAEENIGRFDIPMNDSALMSRVQRREDLYGDLDSRSGLEARSFAFEMTREALTLEQFHDDVGRCVFGKPCIDNLDDARMPKRRSGACLLEITFDRCSVFSEEIVQDLDRNLSAELGVGRGEDSRRVALTKQGAQLKLSVQDVANVSQEAPRSSSGKGF